MLEAFRRWFKPQRPVRPAVVANIWKDAAAWAELSRHTFKCTREGDGFVIDAGLSAQPWRLEWGPSQRTYIQGHELRFRMELQLPSGLQMLVLNRSLLESLERESFERYTEVNQTQVDVSTSEEMRWVTMFPQSELATQRVLRPHFAALSSSPSQAESWLNGELAEALVLAHASVLPKEMPWVLMTLRGRVYMRMALPEPKAALLNAMSKLFVTACTAALRVSVSGLDGAESSTSAATDSLAPLNTAWQSDVGSKK